MLAIILGVIVIFVVAVALYSATSSPVKIDRATPAGTVQVYLDAVIGGKTTEAATLLSPRSPCTATDLDRAYVNGTSRVDLLSSAIDGAIAEVRVRVEFSADAPFGNPMTEEHTFRLMNSGGKWLLDGIPWPLYDCGVNLK